jgi:hypothetical protein
VIASIVVAVLGACGSQHHPPVLGSYGPDSGVGSCGASDAGPVDPSSLIAGSATVVGRVLDPGGSNPLYDVGVYIARTSDLPPLSQGVSCDRCGSVQVNPIASALTDEHGVFSLPNVPVGTQTLVVQVGKWRKVVTIEVTQGCYNTGDLTLPRNGTEGDMPQIAVTTGAADALECLLLSIGIDQSEFVPGAGGTGHVHMFNGAGGHGVTGSPDAGDALWNDKTKLAAYDIVLLSCEGAEFNENKTNKQALHDYAEAGGRVFATHYHYTWFKNGPQADFQNVAVWGVPGVPDAVTYDVNQTFPKGKSFSEWLYNVNASTTAGEIDLVDVKDSVTSINTAMSQQWIGIGPTNVKYFSFNTPIAVPATSQCGRVVFSDIHVSGTGGGTFPSGCFANSKVVAQQEALEFLFFDLSACVQSDSQAPSAVH